MIFEHSLKNKKVLLLISLIILVPGIFVFFYSPVIFQEGNPWPQIKGMVQLKFGDSDIVKLSGSDNKFMTESKNGTIIHDFMKTKGYEFTGQMGSGYFFKSAIGQTAVVTHRYYGRHYSLWTITENKENSLAEKLRDCLPKSDTVSHEICNELLKQIVDFDSCVVAGFSILKFSPAQCATPDGRTFIQETNSTWEQALSAVNNCEVEKAFQAHSRIVTLTLKNGDKLIVKEPQIDDIINIIRTAESKCGKVQIGTE
jgi:uncharacterized protein YlzI (FlbEa/FlbD family)